jgi:hypothetical protein
MALAPPLVGIGSCPCKLLLNECEILFSSFMSLFTAGTMTGFDASGHIAEETRNAR